ncbi:hypothetical protein HGRIS_001536 [Hohenbuehelia grisea]|uniref:Uncharacterized protein n=1 Tax=Hohenbuehelia grisea TaxID=104357 RepID=A0ABR3JR52_9AGAR
MASHSCSRSASSSSSSDDDASFDNSRPPPGPEHEVKPRSNDEPIVSGEPSSTASAEPRNSWILKWRTQLRPAAMAPMRGTLSFASMVQQTSLA